MNKSTESADYNSQLSKSLVAVDTCPGKRVHLASINGILSDNRVSHISELIDDEVLECTETPDKGSI